MKHELDDADRLRELYHGAGMTQKQIGELYGFSARYISKLMHKHGVETRYKSSGAAAYGTYNGYEQWGHKYDGEKITVYVHQLLAISEGADPHKVFSNGEYHIHHDNGIGWDNRPENIELVKAGEHRKIHIERGDYNALGRERVYTDEEMIEWLWSFKDHFGFRPRSDDLRGWPGPSISTYRYRFGSFSNALREAGLVGTRNE